VGKSVHARRIDGGVRYRVWGSTVDAYLTDPMTEPELRAWLLEAALDDVHRSHARRADQLVDTANVHGSSGLRKRALDAPWETERCRGCETFHHAYRDRPAGRGCAECGAAQTDRAHAPPCAEEP
jgi:hypothetical protein